MSSGCIGTVISGVVEVPAAPVVVVPEMAAPVVVVKAVEPAKSAQLTVELPADAKLYVDGVLTKGTGATRQFHTPSLVAGESFFYDMKAEIEVNGRTEVEQKRVIVRAGDSLNEAFPKLIAAAASTRDPLASAAK
ncbi:hypothetical protein FRUB_08688 [Fimbriiglobus ruber]|uniref:PEGA domain-containing protein n=2 Tax=Fimbriiglobus ruber TaxID=1908690 RepID=A0A225DID3_9BACT|nr:hypothetical protein FRUB_08688 [Fimbriiglobus ruber]